MSKRSGANSALVASLMTMLVFYDFVLFAVLMPIIGTKFFPGDAGSAYRILSVALLWSVSYLARPVGAVVFAPLGDRVGRVPVIAWAAIASAGATAICGLLPSDGTIGVAAPALLLVLRVVQGLAAGAGYPGVLAYVGERVSTSQRTVWLAVSIGFATLGFLLAQLFVTILSSELDPTAFSDWGWRLPFVGALVLGVLAFLAIRSLPESEVFLARRERGDVPRHAWSAVLPQFWRLFFGPVLFAGLLSVVVEGGVFFALPHMLGQGVSLTDAMWIYAVTLLLMLAGAVALARVGRNRPRRPAALLGFALVAVAAVPMNLLLNLDPLGLKLLGLLLIVPGLALALSVYGAVIVEQGIASARFLSVGLSNLGYGLLSSWTLPLLILIDKPGDTTLIWGIVLVIGACAGFVVSLGLRQDRAGAPLEP